MSELKLREDQVVVPVSVEELTRTLTPAKAAAVLGQAIRGGGQFFATKDGEIVYQKRPGQAARVIQGVTHKVDGVDAGPRFKLDIEA